MGNLVQNQMTHYTAGNSGPFPTVCPGRGADHRPSALPTIGAGPRTAATLKKTSSAKTITILLAQDWWLGSAPRHWGDLFAVCFVSTPCRRQHRLFPIGKFKSTYRIAIGGVAMPALVSRGAGATGSTATGHAAGDYFRTLLRQPRPRPFFVGGQRDGANVDGHL